MALFNSSRSQPLPRRRKWLRAGYLCSGLLILCVLLANYTISSNAKGKLFTSVESCPAVNVALVPGTSKKLTNGHANLYFKHRVEAAVRLYRAGKVHYFILSGDNSTKDYNEPQMLFDELVAKGVDSSCIYRDYAGFDTWDSMERAKRVFGQQKLLIISQQFQNERAIYIGKSLGMTVYGFNARDVKSYGGFRTHLREKFARLKVFKDLWIGHKLTPADEKIVIGIPQK